MNYQAVPAEDPGEGLTTTPIHRIKRKPLPGSPLQLVAGDGEPIPFPASTVKIVTGAQSEEQVDSPKSRSPATGEWTPFTLRRLFLFFMAGVIVSFIVALIIITIVSRANEGFPGDDSIINNLAIYLPTIIVILFGFIWQRLVSDVKKVAPWSILASGWSPARETLFTGYLNDVEVLSLCRAGKRGHWAIFVGILGGFLCGLLVVFTNTLFFVDPQHTISESSSAIRTTSQIQLNKLSNTPNIDPLVLFQPIIAHRMYQGAALPWTTDRYVFNSFGLEKCQGAADSTSIVAESLGYNPGMSCEHLQYRVTNTTDWMLESESGRYGYGVLFINLELKPDNEDMTCPFTHHVWYRLAESRTTFGQESYSVSWLNTTNCGGDDHRLLITTVRYVYNSKAKGNNRRQFTKDGPGSPDPGTFYTAGLRCRPILTAESMFLTVNMSSAIEGQSTLSQIEPGSLNAAPPNQSLGGFLTPLLPLMNPTAVKALFLRNGTEFLRTEIFTKFHLNEPYLDENGTMIGSSYLTGPPWDNFIDPWFYILTEGNLTKLDSYRENLNELGADSQILFTTIWVHLLDLYARQDLTIPLNGDITTHGPRLMVSGTSAWALVAILVILLGIITCLATVFKPITHLSEDPGSLAAVSVVLAGSPRLRELFKERGYLREPNLRFLLASYKVRTQPTGDRLPNILVDSIPVLEQKAEKPIIPTSKKWRPASLHPFSRILVIAAVIGCIATLVVLRIETPDGFSWDSERNRWLIERIPIVILVLMGYALAGIDSAIQSLQPYRALRKGGAKAEQTLLFKAGNHSVFTVKVDNSFSAMLNVTEPVDYVEAALYTNAYTLTALEQLYNVSNSPNFVGSGKSSSLVIGNLTDSSVNNAIYKLLATGGDAVATLPALNIVISCNSTSGLEEVEFRDGTLDSPSCYKNIYEVSYASGGYTFMFDGGDYTSIAIAKCDGQNVIARTGVWCKRTFQEVNVNVTLQQRTVNNLGQKSTTALEIRDIDVSSVAVINSSLAGGDWFYPVLFPEAVVRTDGGYGVNGSLGLDNMTAYSGPGWNVTAAMSTYSPTFVNILLTGVVSRGQDIEDLFDPAILQPCMEKLYLAFHVHAIDQMRTLAPVHPNPVMKPVLVVTEDLRLKQSGTSTIIVCALLGLILLLTFLALIAIQGRGIVNMPPTTLAAQFALLSDSSMVDELANSRVTSTLDTNIWYDNRFAMGWMSQTSQSAVNTGKNTRLWGVDFDEKILRRD